VRDGGDRVSLPVGLGGVTRIKLAKRITSE